MQPAPLAGPGRQPRVDGEARTDAPARVNARPWCARSVDGAAWRRTDGQLLLALGPEGDVVAVNENASAAVESCEAAAGGRGCGLPLCEAPPDHVTSASPCGSSSALTTAQIVGMPVVEPVPSVALLPPPGAARQLALTRWGVRIVVDDAAGADLTPVLPDHGLEPENGASVDVHYAIRMPADRSPRFEVERTRGEEHALVVAPGRDELVTWLRRDVDESVAACSRRGLFARAGAVTWRGHVVIVTDQGGPGPSPLIGALVRLGATRHAEPFAVFDDAGHVHAPSASAPSRPPRPPTLIVAMRYERDATWRPRVLRGAEAALVLLGCMPGARSDPSRGVRLVTRLAATVTTLTGPMPAAHVAAPRVLRLLDDLIDGRPLVADAAASCGSASETLEAHDDSRGLVPAQVVTIDDFLEPDDHERVLAFARAQEASFEVSQVMAGESATVMDAFRRSRTLFSLDALWPIFEIRVRRALPFVRHALGLPWFPPGRVERQLTAHQEGGIFGVHVDNGEPGLAGRRVTGVYYFHGHPKRFSGGELRVYDRVAEGGRSAPAQTYRVVECVDNRVVFFASDVPHEVRPVRCETDVFGDSRFAVNIWFWTGPRVPRPGTEPL